MKYKKIFFDLDHTLWDFDGNCNKTLNLIYEEFDLKNVGINNVEEFKASYNKHNAIYWKRFRKGYVTRKDMKFKRMWHTLLDFKIGNEKLAHDLSFRYMNLLPQQAVLMPYTMDILNYCVEKNYRLSIITNGFESSQMEKMRVSNIGHYFEKIISSEKSNSRKPKKEIFDFALQITNSKREECLMIGDSLEADIIGAQQSGIDQVFYNPRLTQHTEKPTFEIKCLSELRDIF